MTMYTIRQIALWAFTLLPIWLSAQTPADIDGLELWLRADQAEVVEGVLTWNDLSTNENNATQTLPAAQPAITGDGPAINNQPAVVFDGLDDHLLVDNSLTVGTVFVVANYTNPAGLFDSFDGLLTGQSGGNDNVLFIGANGTSGFYSSGFFGSNMAINGLSTTSFAPVAQWKYIRGYSAIPSLFSNLVIGRDRGNNARIWHGGIAEIIVFSTLLTSQEVDEITAYLFERYTPPITLDSSYEPQNYCPADLDAGEGFLSYSWSTEESTQTIQTDTAGTFYVDVTTTFGQVLTDTTTVTYPGNFIDSFILCAGSDSLWDTGLNSDDFTFAWSDGSTQPSYLFETSDSVQVTVFDSDGCSLTSLWVVATLDVFPQIDVLPPTIDLCEGGALVPNLPSTDGLTFNWSTGSDEPFVSVFSEGIISVEITNENGCSITDQTDVSIVGVSPEVDFSSAYTCSAFEMGFSDLSVSQDASEIVSWQWTFGDGTESTDQNLTHVYPASGVYSVTLIVETDSGCAAQVMMTVDVPSMISSAVHISNNCVGYSTTIIDSATVDFDSITSMEWSLYNDMGEFIASETTSEFDWVFLEEGVYQFVRVYETDLGCEQQIVDEIEILPASACFLPTEMESLTLWLAADSLVSSSGGMVTSWGDLSTTNDMAQGTSPVLPQWITGVPALNGRNAVRMNAVNSWMEFSEITQGRTVVALVKHQSGTQENFPTLFGHETEVDFIGDNGTLLFRAISASPDLIQGVGRANGIDQDVAEMEKPAQYSILSFVPNSPLRVQYISKDRNSTNRGWLGDYVELLVFDQFLDEEEVEQIEQYLRFKYAPPVRLPDNITQNYGFCPVELAATKAFYTEYLWSTGETSGTINVTESGMYTVAVTDIYGYTSTDSVEVTFPGTFLSGEIAVCSGDSLTYNLGLPADVYTFLWNTGDTTATITTAQPGQYSVVVEDSTGCTFSSDPIELSIDFFPEMLTIDISPTFCDGNPLTLLPSDVEISHQTWSTGETTPSIIPQNEGDYWVLAQNSNGCIGRDTVTVSFAGVAPIAGYVTNALCEQSVVMFWDSSYVTDNTPITDIDWVISGEQFSGPQVDFTFDQSGPVEVILTVHSADGCVTELVDTIYVNPTPDVGFSTSLPCSGQSTLFEDFSTISEGSITEWSWDFGMGSTGNQPNETVQFETPGAYPVSLTVTSGEGCTATHQETVLVNPSPEAAFTWSPTCQGDLMYFESDTDTSLTGPLNYAWNFANVSAPGQTAQHLFPGAGDYVVTHEVWTTLNGVPACFSEVTETVVVSAAPEVEFTASAACAGSAFTLTDETVPGQSDFVTEWTWSTNNQFIDSLPNAEWTFAEQGEYPISLLVKTEAGCVASQVEWIMVGVNAQPDISFSPQVGLPPLEVSFSNLSGSNETHFWDFGDGSELEESLAPMHTYLDTGVFYISLIVIDEVGCTGTDIDSIFVIKPYFDVSVEAVSVERNGNFISISCVIGNFNNHPLTNARVSAWLGNGSVISKQWEGILAKNQLTTFHFENELSFDSQINDPFVCVEITEPNGDNIDQNLANNRRCVSFSDGGFEVYAPYPNPTEGGARQIVELPKAAELSLQITRPDGRVLSTYDQYFPAGISLINWDTENLAAGVYILSVAMKSEVKWHKLMVIKNR